MITTNPAGAAKFDVPACLLKSMRLILVWRAIDDIHMPAAGLSFGAAVTSLAASGVQQLLSPRPWSFGFDSFTDIATFYGSDRYPLVGPAFTEIGEAAKNSAWENQVKNSSQTKEGRER
jgi:hypothetical protein